MDDKKFITEYFMNDDPPATITEVESLEDLGEHYYKITGHDENGEFSTNVLVVDSSVQILPE